MTEIGGVEKVGGGGDSSNRTPLVPPVESVAETTLDLHNKPNSEDPNRNEKPKRRRKRPDPLDTTGRIIDVEI